MSLLEAVDRTVVQWAGIGLLHPCNRHPEIVAGVRRHCPILDGLTGIRRVAGSCDVLLLWGIPNSLAMLSEKRTCRVIMVSHGVGVWTERAMADAAGAEVLVAVSHTAVQPFPADQRGRVRVIPNGVDPARVVPRRDRESVLRGWGVPENRSVLGYLGRLSTEKYPQALVAAVAALPANWVGVALGDGPLRAGLEGSERCYFPGATSDVGSALGAFDALLLPSYEEACSLTLLEAWLAGVPVIATPVGLVPELPWAVRQIPVGASGAEIAAAVRADRVDTEGTRERVDRARRHAAAEFTLEPFGRRWTALLRETGRRPRQVDGAS